MVDRPLRTAAITSKRWVGAAVARKEDQALLTGQARFIDDLSPIPGLRFAAILRSPHPHVCQVPVDVPINDEVDALNLGWPNAALVFVAGDQDVVMRGRSWSPSCRRG